MNGSAKYNHGINTKGDNIVKYDNISIGKVVSNTDEYDGNRIKVRIKGIDDKYNDSDLPFCFPLIPKFVNIVPDIGESVFIFLLKDDNKVDNRMWVGPIISQPQKLKNDPHYYSSSSLLSSGIVQPEKAPSSMPDARGVYPDKKDIAIQGRDNSDLIFKKNEVVLRAGKFETGNNLKFNKKNTGYIQIKYNVSIDDKKTKGTVTNIVSDKINLISHKGNPSFVLNNQDMLITDDELLKICNNAHPLVYGDVLLEFIKLVKNFIIGHSHPYAGLEPVKDSVVKDVINFKLNTMLSENIRIN